MDYIPIEQLLDKSGGSIYKLVVLAAKRTLELVEGQPSLISGNSLRKPASIALLEIASGKVRIK
ncbi:MAG: DNA-directed RNA polymerase subunit omega [Candidatus Omnitrophota bacterium]